MSETRVRLRTMAYRGYHPGRSPAYRALWLVVEAAVLLNPVVTPYWLKRWVLRRFGARIGRGVVIKPNVHVKYPWHLRVGDDAWLGERSWIDNFVTVEIGANACISQGAYLCTGNHDWSDPGMALVVKPITIGSGAWVGAFAKICPGVTVGKEAVIALGSVLTMDADESGIYAGIPAGRIGTRVIRDEPGAAGRAAGYVGWVNR
jgi:putative colanic acid biosynthesis acetyltransferase WcaF